MVVEVSPLAAVETKSATSAQRLATLPETALRLVGTVAVDMVDNKEATVVASAVDDKEVKPATHVVVTATCQETAPRVKSATTVGRLAI